MQLFNILESHARVEVVTVDKTSASVNPDSFLERVFAVELADPYLYWIVRFLSIELWATPINLKDT